MGAMFSFIVGAITGVIIMCIIIVGNDRKDK